MSALTKVQEKSKNASEANFRAFVADDESRKAVEQVVGELMIPSAAVIRGNVRDAIEHLGTTRSPRLLLVDLSGRQLPLSDINELAEVCEPGVRVIAVGDRNDVGLFSELLGQGITVYVVKQGRGDRLD
ncbi:MAG: pilus assembly protein CpaE, partial [Pseudomonadota bacterium]